MIILGIPEKQNENLYDVIKTIGRKLDVTLDEAKYSTYRLGREIIIGDKTQRGRPIKIIFRDEKTKPLLLKSKKRIHLNSTDLGYADNNKVYLNHDLTKSNLELFKEAKAYKKDNDYKFVWTSRGNIFLRKDEQAKIIQVEDINQLKN